MALADLVAVNRLIPAQNTAGPTPPSIEALRQEACVLSTCLREVLVASDPKTDIGMNRNALEPKAPDTDHSLLQGAAAYRFLLQLASGLESEIPGETEILGQIKEAWQHCEQQRPKTAAALRPWMQRLLQDAKEIRSEYVVGLGSVSYGALVRRLLGPNDGRCTLLLGAGQLAEAVLPYLEAPRVLVCNRNRERAQSLIDRQRLTATTRRLEVIPANREREAWQAADLVLLCIPPDEIFDAERLQWWQACAEPRPQVLHLGLLETAGTAWAAVPSLITLRALFALRDSQAERRAALLEKARQACFVKAELARLDDAAGARAGNLCHGWEDLAAFHAFS